MYCKNCGKEISDKAYICPFCGCLTGENNPLNPKSNRNKSKISAGLLALFIGTLGIHNFYLGKNKRGLTQLLITIGAIAILVIGTLVFTFSFANRYYEFEEYIEYYLDGMIIAYLAMVLFCVLAIIGVGIWAFIESIMIFAGAIKDNEGRELI